MRQGAAVRHERVGQTLRRALESTAQFYEVHAAEYFQRTVTADLSAIHDRFLAFVPTAGHILDAGCGSGRDLQAFARRGYQAMGIDASHGLVRLAARYASVPCHLMRFEELPYADRFDAIWACASLLHVPKSMVESVLRRFARALVPHGILFTSVQIGHGELLGNDGRFFAYYSKAEFEGVVKTAGFEIIESWTSEDALPGRGTVRWINVISRARRRRDVGRAKSTPFSGPESASIEPHKDWT